MKHIGIMGGTFNPIHNGHLFLAEAVREKLSLDKIMFIPTGNPPHKDRKDLADNFHRLNMVKLAIKGNPYFCENDLEIRREGKTYTIDTLKELHKLDNDSEFYFIIGFDTLKEILTWKDIKSICDLCSFVVVNRNNSSIEINNVAENLRITLSAKIHVVEMPNIDISSSYVREKHLMHKSIKYLVPDDVINYIDSNGLYI